jgi:hypothetical protein
MRLTGRNKILLVATATMGMAALAIVIVGLIVFAVAIA